ncbi:MAG TPA: hypothetical protein VF638_14425 [Sphingomonas sp.]|jgi:hypothetical protein
MDNEAQVTTRVTRTVTVDMTEQYINDLLIRACGFTSSARVDWDASGYGVRGATVTHSTVKDEA